MDVPSDPTVPAIAIPATFLSSNSERAVLEPRVRRDPLRRGSCLGPGRWEVMLNPVFYNPPPISPVRVTPPNTKQFITQKIPPNSPPN